MGYRIYQRGENFYIDFTFKGKRIRESIGPNQKLAEKVIAKRKVEIAENKYLDVRKELKPIPFHEFAVEYIAWSKANKKPLSYREDIYRMRRLEKEFGSQNLQGITTWLIEKYKSRRRKMNTQTQTETTYEIINAKNGERSISSSLADNRSETKIAEHSACRII